MQSIPLVELKSSLTLEKDWYRWPGAAEEECVVLRDGSFVLGAEVASPFGVVRPFVDDSEVTVRRYDGACPD